MSEWEPMRQHMNAAIGKMRESTLEERGTSNNPMCVNCYCPSSLMCSRFICEPVSDPVEGATVFIDPEPDEAGRCPEFVALAPCDSGSHPKDENAEGS